MADVELRIRNGKVFTNSTLVSADVLVAGGRIVGLVSRDDPRTAFRDIDAKGKWVLPGIVDLHAHTREPGYTYKEDFLTCSQAAAIGGITTWIDMPNVDPPTDTVERFLAKRELASAKAIVDFGHFCGGKNPEEVEKFAAAGASGFKIFQVSGAYPHDPRLAENDSGALLRSMRAIEETGLVCVVHPFNQSLFEQLVAEARAAGEPMNHYTFGEVYTQDAIWRTAVAVLLGLQELSGVRLHLVHTHAAGSLRLLKDAKERGQRVTVEVDPKYYHLSRKDLDEKGPLACPGGYITEDEERMRTIWRSINDGTIDVFGSDHAPHTREDLAVMYRNAFEAAMGSPQYDYLYSLHLTDVFDGKMSLATAVRLLCENTARILGLFPRKGAILPGSDADLVIVDPDETFVATDEGTATRVGWTPYAGWRLRGRVRETLVRGTTVARDGVAIGQPGHGRFVQAVPQRTPPDLGTPLPAQT